MIRQYFAQHCCGGYNPLRVGVIPCGAIFYLQSDSWWRDSYRSRPICREPRIVESFLNGTIGSRRRNRDTGLWESVYISGRSAWRSSARCGQTAAASFSFESLSCMKMWAFGRMAWPILHCP